MEVLKKIETVIVETLGVAILEEDGDVNCLSLTKAMEEILEMVEVAQDNLFSEET